MEQISSRYVAELCSEAAELYEQLDKMVDAYNSLIEELWANGYNQAIEIGEFMGRDLTCGMPCTLLSSYPSTLRELPFNQPQLSWIQTGEAKKRERVKAKSERRRDVVSSQRLAIGEKHGWTCVYCGGHSPDPHYGPDGRAWHIDHVYAKSLGGDNGEDNLVLACATCNLSKHNSLIAAFLSRRGQTTALVSKEHVEI